MNSCEKLGAGGGKVEVIHCLGITKYTHLPTDENEMVALRENRVGDRPTGKRIGHPRVGVA